MPRISSLLVAPVLLAACTSAAPPPDADPGALPDEVEPPPSVANEVEPHPEPVDPRRAWFPIETLPTAEILLAPPRETWPESLPRGKTGGWTFAKLDKGLKFIGLHDSTSGLFASRAGARRFARGHVPLEPSGDGTCFRAVWPYAPSFEVSQPRDSEPMLVPEPHVLMRTGPWTGKVGWVQETRLLPTQNNPDQVVLRLREGWGQVRPPRFKAESNPYDVTLVLIAEVADAGRSFSVFAAREDESVHMLVAALDDQGRLEHDIFVPHTMRIPITCPWQRLDLEQGLVTKHIPYGEPRGGAAKIIATRSERDGADGVEISIDWIDPDTGR